MNNHLYRTHTYYPDYCDCQGLPKFLRVWHDKYCHYSLAAIKLSSNKNKLRLYLLHCHVTKSVPTTVTWQDQTYCRDNCHSLVTRSHLLFWQLSNDKIIHSWQLSHCQVTSSSCPYNCQMTRSHLLSWQLSHDKIRLTLLTAAAGEPWWTFTYPRDMVTWLVILTPAHLHTVFAIKSSHAGWNTIQLFKTLFQSVSNFIQGIKGWNAIEKMDNS